ncbi:hypothetical protein BLA34_23135 [Ralstonia solanacearum]|nr:hypothetical protein BLA34_23135 [Ralstonia solanacearum]
MANSAGTQSTTNGPFETSKAHAVGAGFLDALIDDYESIATNFAINAIRDDYVRQRYIAHIREISDQVRKEVDSGNMTVKEGAQFCSQLRDKLFVEYRKYTSAVGVAKAEKIKLEARGFDYYLNKYAQEQFGKDFQALSTKERNAVYYTTLIKAGGGNSNVTTKVRGLQVYAKAGLVMTAVLGAYAITKADNKLREAARQGSIIAGGMIGGGLAGFAVSFVCGPAEPFCAVALVYIGTNLGGMAGEVVNDVYQDELEAFMHWVND